MGCCGGTKNDVKTPAAKAKAKAGAGSASKTTKPDVFKDSDPVKPKEMKDIDETKPAQEIAAAAAAALVPEPAVIVNDTDNETTAPADAPKVTVAPPVEPVAPPAPEKVVEPVKPVEPGTEKPQVVVEPEYDEPAKSALVEQPEEVASPDPQRRPSTSSSSSSSSSSLEPVAPHVIDEAMQSSEDSILMGGSLMMEDSDGQLDNYSSGASTDHELGEGLYDKKMGMLTEDYLTDEEQLVIPPTEVLIGEVEGNRSVACDCVAAPGWLTSITSKIFGGSPTAKPEAAVENPPSDSSVSSVHGSVDSGSRSDGSADQKGANSPKHTPQRSSYSSSRSGSVSSAGSVPVAVRPVNDVKSEAVVTENVVSNTAAQSIVSSRRSSTASSASSRGRQQSSSGSGQLTLPTIVPQKVNALDQQVSGLASSRAQPIDSLGLLVNVSTPRA